MILLTSDGLTSEQLIKAAADSLHIVGGKAAIVTTASVQYKNRDSNVPVLSSILADMGLESVCVDVEYEDAYELLAYDVVILIGGDPFYLRKHLLKWRHIEDILYETGKNKVLVGISAGSMVLGETMEYAAGIEDDSSCEEGVNKDGFGIVPYNIFPHYKAYQTMYPQLEEIIRTYVRQTGRRILPINDCEGMIIKEPGCAGTYISNDIYIPEIRCRNTDMNYDNYIFDIYGTLIDINTDEESYEHWSFMTKYYSYLGAVYKPEEMKRRYIELVMEEENRILKKAGNIYLPEIDLINVFAKLYEEKNVHAGRPEAEAAAHVFRSSSMRYIRLYYGARQLLLKLKREGKKLYILSNAQRVFTEAELKYLGIYDYFDDIYISSDYACKKPDRHFLEFLLNDHRLKPEKTIMIGNSAGDDIYPALAAGLKTCYICSNLSDKRDRPECDIFMKTMDMPLLAKILCQED